LAATETAAASADDFDRKSRQLNEVTVRKFVFALGALLLLSVAACGPLPPTYADPMQGLYDGSAAAVPADRPVAVRRPLALVFSNNVETYLQYTEAGIKGLKSHIMVNAQAGRDIDPNRLADRIVGMFKARYPDVAMADDLAEAARTGAKTVCLVDIQVAFGRMSGDTTKVELNTIFFDDKPAPVSRMRGYGQGVVPYPAWDVQFTPASEAALRELEGKLVTLLR
jgi:hypothetical protein